MMLGRSRHESGHTDDIPLVNPSEFVYQAPFTRSISDNESASQYEGKQQEIGTHHNDPAVAIRKSRNIPLIQWLTHGSSVLVTVVLIFLCARNVYFADLTKPNINSILNAFQFIARLHEIIVTASFTMMVIYQLRYELVAASGVPLGLLTNAYSLTQPQMLFTKEFWKATMSRSNVKRKYWFSILILASTILIALTGPSSAILMIPQLDWWDLKHPFSDTLGYSWLNSTYDDRWLTSINASLVPQYCDPLWIPIAPACPYANTNGLAQWGADQLSQWAPPNITVQTQAGMSRYLTASNTSEWQAESGITVASTAMDDLTRNMGTIWLYASRNNFRMSEPGRPMITLRSLNSSKPILRPLVQVQCGPIMDVTNQTTIDLMFPANKLVQRTGASSINNVSQTIDLQDYQSSTDDIRFNYTDLSSEAGQPLLGAVASISLANPSLIFGDRYNNETKARGIIACTMLANWVPSLISRDVKIDNVVTIDNPDPSTILTNPTLMSQLRDLQIDLTWAQASTPSYNDNSGLSVMENQLESLAFDRPFYDGAWKDRWPWLISSMISMSITDGLARLDSYKYTYVWRHNSTHPRQSYAVPIDDLNLISYQQHNLTNGSIAHFIESSPDLYHPVTWTVTRYGYAWSFDRVPKYLATLVVALHTSFVIGHVLIVLTRKWRCDSWDTLTKLVVLAMQSPPSGNLKGASSGISDSSTYTDIVRIRESRDSSRDNFGSGGGGGNALDAGGASAVLTVSGHRQIGQTSSYSAVSDATSLNEQGYTNTYNSGHQDTKLVFGKKYL